MILDLHKLSFLAEDNSCTSISALLSIVFHKNSAKNTEAKEQNKERVTKSTNTLINAQNLNASYLAWQTSLLLSDSRALVLASCNCQSCNKALSPVPSVCLLSG